MNQRTPIRLDGNSLAGPLADLFAIDPMTAWRICPGCRALSSIAELHVYGPQPGFTGRCPHCQQLALRIVQQPGRLWLQLGTDQGAFRFTLPPSAGSAYERPTG
ncbi:DUF6510 family protein [Streptomyces sp. NPDC101178]|uniref:DUF6510 family protein n=1 Tax=Streptomyces sp. NPDC101178 TaxID=3366124 RepID=UPI00381942A3